MADRPQRPGALEVTRSGAGNPLRWPSGYVRYSCRVRYPDGTRVRNPVPEAYCYSEERAREYIAAVQEEMDAKAAQLIEDSRPQPGPEGELVRDWVDRYANVLRARGVVTVDDIVGRLRNWPLRHFGDKAMKDVERADIEALICELDEKVRERARQHEGKGVPGKRVGLSWKSALNIWSDTSRIFAEACESKDPALRVLSKNPTENIRGPDKGVARTQPFLRPIEVDSLLSASEVPVYRRVLYGVAIYTAMRQGELRALLPDDIDFSSMQIRVSKQVRTGEVRNRTKTGRARYVAIEPNLLPLLRYLVEHPMGRDGRLVKTPPPEDCAELIRKDLETAQCKRNELHADDAMREHMTFHKLRHTCGVHMAVRRDEPFDVQWRMGHTNAQMTERYIQEARQESRGNFGEPLAPLPRTLFEDLHGVGNDSSWGSDRPSSRPSTSKMRHKPREIMVTPTGIEPVLPA